MKTLVIGGTGYVGGHIAERLHSRGFDVTVFSRGRTRGPLPAGVKSVHGDRHAPEDIRPLARAGFDAVVDAGANRRDETQAAVDAFDGYVSRFVHVSTVAVSRAAAGSPLRDTASLVTDPREGYAYEKAECERALRQAHAKNDFPFVALRPPVVFGPRDRASRENYFLKRALSGDVVILPDGGWMPACNLFVRDLADAVAGAVVSESAPGRTYYVAARERVPVSRHLANIAAMAGRDVEAVTIPARLLERAGFTLAWFPYYGAGEAVELDTSAAERDLDFRPTPYAAALEETVRYFLQEGPESLPSIEDCYPPVIPRARQSAFARRYASQLAAFEDAFAAGAGDLMEGYR
jgi:nucleoside-diphosphate-sugar epimerase